MSWKHVALVPLIFALASCAADGGSRGTGISTAVEGNVVSVQMAAHPQRPPAGAAGLFAALREALRIEKPARAGTAIEGIHVAVEGTDIQTMTDAEGTFLLRGNFEGKVTILFQTPGQGSPSPVAINVPAAGTLTLNDVTIYRESAKAFAAAQNVDFEGIITETDCRALTVTMVSVQQAANDQDQYTLRLDTSSVQDAQGSPLGCVDLRGGEQAMVQGEVNPDGTFGHATVRLVDS